FGIAVDGDHLNHLRAGALPIIARVRDGQTFIDLRSVDPGDDEAILAALTTLTAVATLSSAPSRTA
ncbi:MAG: hypothetical protein ABIW84_10425, partial [Ilumatobacteraceae bacterium]